MKDFKKGGRRPRKDSRPRRRDSGEVSMHKAVCDKCGETCEVPFKPTAGKPVYCDDCFKKKDKSGRGPDFSKELEQINEKLDKILEAVENNS